MIKRRGRGSTGRAKKPPSKAEDDLFAEVQQQRAENAYLKNLQALVLEEDRRQRNCAQRPEGPGRRGYFYCLHRQFLNAAVHATFLQTEIQNCIIHQLRMVTKANSVFLSDDNLLKMLYITMMILQKNGQDGGKPDA